MSTSHVNPACHLDNNSRILGSFHRWAVENTDEAEAEEVHYMPCHPGVSAPCIHSGTRQHLARLLLVHCSSRRRVRTNVTVQYLQKKTTPSTHSPARQPHYSFPHPQSPITLTSSHPQPPAFPIYPQLPPPASPLSHFPSSFVLPSHSPSLSLSLSLARASLQEATPLASLTPSLTELFHTR